MGCIASKDSTPRNIELTEVEVKEQENVMGLTKRQRFLLKGSWKGVSRELQLTGVRLFVQMFQTHPETLELFPKFSDLDSADKQQNSEVFKEHGEKVFIRIDEALASADDPDVLTSILLETGAYHKKIPGFKPEMFWYAEEPFLEALRVTLDERYTAQMDVIYHVISRYIIQTLIDGYNK